MIKLTSKRASKRATTSHGIYRHKYHLRALCQSVAFLLLLGGYIVYNGMQGGHAMNGAEAISEASARRLTEIDQPANDVPSQRERRTHRIETEDIVSAPRNTLATTNATTEECEAVKADPEWFAAVYAVGVLYMFLALAIVCDEFFVPALEEMSSVRRMNLSMDVAGATLMAAGGSAPELFTNLFSTFDESAAGFGTIVGSAVFNVLFVIAMCSLLSKETLALTWWPLFRDSTYYAVGLIVLAYFVGYESKNEIHIWEQIVLLVLYFGYILLMWQNGNIYKAITGRELEYPDEDGDDDDNNPEDFDDPEGPQRRMNASELNLGRLESVRHFRWQGTFRAGILKLLRDPESWIETAGVGIVAKIAGDADFVFRQIDANRDGSIDKSELKKLFEVLDCNLSSQELDDVFEALDIDKDGTICEEEFTKWYVQSEERIRSQVRQVFDKIDANDSGTIDKQELKTLLETLDPRVTDADVEEALSAMHETGSREEISFEEFDNWYRHSILFERQKKAVEEDMEGVMENLRPPFDGGLMDWLKYLMVLPLVFVLTISIPDVRRPGMSVWCYLAFVLSIVWIGLFAFFMVTWASIIGNTVGIPDVVMGLTVLAAGTSVPDMLSSVIVARRGEGDMAVSSSIGSNIFDILVGLPFPWLLYSLFPDTNDFVEIGSDNIATSIIVLFGMLVFVIVTVHCQGWQLTKTLAFLMLFFYFGFLGQSIYLELPFPECSS